MKYLMGFILCISFCTILVGCNTFKNDDNAKSINHSSNVDSPIVNNPENNDVNPENNEEDMNYEIVGGDQLVSRALAAKMIALANYDKSSIEIRDREINYLDTTPEDWYDKYINTVVVDGWMKGKEDKFYPLEPLTYSEFQEILEVFNMDLSQIVVSVHDKKANETVNLSTWSRFIDKLLEGLNDYDGVNEKEMIVFATPSVSSDLDAWEMATDHGMYRFEGLTMDAYLDQKIKVKVRGNEIMSIRKVMDIAPILTNVYIESVGDQTVNAFMGGISREININPSMIQIAKPATIGDFLIEDHEIKALELKERTFTDVVKLINYSEIDFQEKGQYPVAKDVKVYSEVNGLRWKALSSVIVGYQSAQFVLNDLDEVCAIIIKNSVGISNIRVLINTTGFKGYYHNEVRIKGTSDYQIIAGGVSQTYSGEQEITIAPDDAYFADSKRIYVVPSDSNGKIVLDQIKRGYGSNKFSPEYRGIIELYNDEEGILIVNELPVEEYLYAVVPSEMPTAYGLEAAKVQAVCARSYAYTQFYSNRYCRYGAHVDDSVSCQVYNNIKENETSIEAVKQTSRQGLSYNDRVVSANFFSTSSGYTANSGDVWANYKKQFPTSTPEYLSGKPQLEDSGAYKELNDESLFREFITDNTIESYDKAFPWYRWTVEMTREQIENSIGNNITGRYAASPKLIKTLDENDIFRSRSIESIGELKDIWVYSRGNSGIITELIIEGTNGIYKVATEYNIRLLLAPKNYSGEGEAITVFRNDDSEQNNMGLLPSAFFVMDKVYNSDNELIKIIFKGGGYGHGVGMSQNGVKGMVDLGYKYLDILKHYYTGTEVKEIY